MTRWWQSDAAREPWRFDTPKPDDGPPVDSPRATAAVCVLLLAAVLTLCIVAKAVWS